MSEKQVTTKETATISEQSIPINTLLASKQLSGFQPDFARAVLTENEYTLSEAIEKMNKFMKG